MERRYVSLFRSPKLGAQFATALRQTLAEGYSRQDFLADVMAGAVVGTVALPLSMALAIASGVPPQHGLYTAIVAGAAISLLGGSRVQVSGPTAAFVVILAPITARYGVGGLMVSTLIAGIMLFTLGALRLGRLIQFIPHPVTTGFTAGIGTVIATLQLKDFLGLRTRSNPDQFLERVGALVQALPTIHLPDVALGALTLALLILWPRVTKKVPAPLVALFVATLAGVILHALFPEFQVATLASRFSYLKGGVRMPGIPQLPPIPVLPWRMPGPDGHPIGLSLDLLRTLAPSGFAIAMLGAIESLLSAVVSDGMSGFKHDPDAELMAQGVGNVLSPFFGGIAATGAIARTATSIRAGARSPLAAFIHAVFVLLAVLVLAPLLSYLPMASLAALLMIVAYNMSEIRHFGHILAVAPKSDVAVLLSCFFLTVVFDMVVAVTLGVLLAALLFMQRMAELTGIKLADASTHGDRAVPKSVVIYEIAGPLFFGAAQKAMSTLARVDDRQRVVILDMHAVPTLDVTGLVALESAIGKLNQSSKKVILSGIQDQPRMTLEKGNIAPRLNKLAFSKTLDEAVAIAQRYLERNSSPPSPLGPTLPTPS